MIDGLDQLNGDYQLDFNVLRSVLDDVEKNGKALITLMLSGDCNAYNIINFFFVLSFAFLHNICANFFRQMPETDDMTITQKKRSQKGCTHSGNRRNCNFLNCQLMK